MTDPRSHNSDIVNCTYLADQAQGRDDDQQSSPTKRKVHFFSIDQELVYWNFFLDFGPLNLGQLYRFCQKLNMKLQDPRLSNRVLVFFSNASFAKRANAMYLLSAWQVLYMGCSPEDSCAPFKSAVFPDNYGESRQNSPRSVTSRDQSTLSAVPPFHDASPCVCTYDLNILDCLRGLAKARANKFFSFDNFNIKEYEYFEQVEVSQVYLVLSLLPLKHHNLIFVIEFLAERRPQLDCAKQIPCLCWSSIQKKRDKRGLLYSDSSGLHSLFPKQKCWTSC